MLMLLLLLRRASPFVRTTGARPARCIHAAAADAWRACDACGSVVNRYYHCADCPEETGLFDVCTECCAALYLKQGSPRALSMGMPDHPTHDYKNHRMVHITP